MASESENLTRPKSDKLENIICTVSNLQKRIRPVSRNDEVAPWVGALTSDDSPERVTTLSSPKWILILVRTTSFWSRIHLKKRWTAPRT